MAAREPEPAPALEVRTGKGKVGIAWMNAIPAALQHLGQPKVFGCVTHASR